MDIRNEIFCLQMTPKCKPSGWHHVRLFPFSQWRWLGMSPHVLAPRDIYGAKKKNSIWGNGELGHSWCCLADQCLKTCHPDGSSSKQTPWWKHKHQKRWTHWGRTMSFTVVVPPTAPAKRWRSEMELPKSRAGNEHICNRSTSAQHLFLARGLFAGWRDSIEIAHALTSLSRHPKTVSRRIVETESLISLLLSLGPFTIPLCLFTAVLFWCASYIAQAAVTRSGGSNCQWKHYLSEQWTCV